MRRRAAVGVLPCDHLGEAYLSAGQTYLAPHGMVTVRGRVRKLHKGRTFWSLNFGDYWRQDFSVQIPVALAEKMAASGVEFTGIAGQAVEVRGRLSSYNGPNLRVMDAKDLKVLRSRSGAVPWP